MGGVPDYMVHPGSACQWLTVLIACGGTSRTVTDVHQLVQLWVIRLHVLAVDGEYRTARRPLLNVAFLLQLFLDHL